jgi:plastocyanin
MTGRKSRVMDYIFQIRTAKGAVPILLLAVLVLALLGGCGSGAREEAAEEPIETIQVRETEFSLDPNTITLEEPGTYTFRAENAGDTVHVLEIEGEGIEEETEELQPGESADLMVSLEPGTYVLYCPVDDHEDRGMKGTLTIAEGRTATNTGTY